MKRVDIPCPLIIAETAFSHEGSKEYLKQQIYALKGEDNIAIKFQVLIDKDDLLSDSHSLYENIDKWMLSRSDWQEVIDYAYEQNVLVILAILDYPGIELFNENKDKIFAIEIHSSCLVDFHFLDVVEESLHHIETTVILSISGYTIEDLDQIINKHFNWIGRERLILMYGFQNYPTVVEDINLSRTNLYADRYNVSVGYADHTEYGNKFKKDIISMAIGLGSRTIEIHYVNHMGEDRLDYITAYDAVNIIETRDLAKNLVLALGNKTKEMSAAEKSYASVFKKSPLYNQDVEKGKQLKREDIVFKRDKEKNIFGIKELGTLLDKELIKNVETGQAIRRDDFE